MEQISSNTQQNCEAAQNVSSDTQENTEGIARLAEIVGQIKELSKQLNKVIAE